MIKRSAGILVCHAPTKRILLAHPTGNRNFGTHTIPKGGIEDGETPLQAAMRETKEEIGLDLSSYLDILTKKEPKVCEYRNIKNKLYKTIHYYELFVDEQIGDDIFDESLLQLDEIDWAGYVTVDKAKVLILPRQLPIIELISWP